MEDLTFGEQVKIILSRKKMTIKQLAEIIEQETGLKMSRQNLTQRLGRDNFQEQDMRMIAAILGCQFKLSILSGEENTVELPIRKKKVTSIAKAADEPQADLVSKETSAGERDMTIGEIYSLHEELSELEEQKQAKAEAQLEAENEPAIEVEAESVIEPMQEIELETESVQEDERETVLEAELVQEEPLEVQPEEEQEVQVEVEPEAVADPYVGYQGPAHKESRSNESLHRDKHVVTPNDPGFEPVIKHEDLEEDIERGDVNPYTGREYQTNSVRIHPNRIGYVQVYDRSDHKWTDMTEWAFLGYQERKKVLLGKEYEPPIYLD